MSEVKTKENDGNVLAFLNSVENKKRKEDALAILELMSEITGETPKMWGNTIVGFGKYRYKYKSGREGDWPCVGFSPRKANMTLYIMGGFANHEILLEQLGKYKIGKSCLYFSKLENLNLAILSDLISESYIYMKNKKWE